MSLKLVEGWDHYAIGLAAVKGWAITDTADGLGRHLSSSFVAGRINGQALRITNVTAGIGFSGGSYLFRKLLPATYTQFACGFAFRTSQVPSIGIDVFSLKAGATYTFRVVITSVGQIAIVNSSGTAIATGTTVLASNAWNYIEAKGVINGASGSCAVQLNGASEIATTTGNFGSSAIDTVECIFSPNQGLAINGTLDWDDVYIVDTSTSPNNNFLGDIAVETIYPSAAGASTQFTPDTGSNWARVSETAADGDTSYVADSTSAHRDSYAFGNLASALGTVYGVQINSYARKDDAGLRQIAMVTRPTTVNFDGATQTLSTNYGFFSEIKETNPDTSTAWTVSSINAAEFGLKVI